MLLASHYFRRGEPGSQVDPGKNKGDRPECQLLTPMQRAEYSDAMLDAVNRKIPLGRHARPEEVAAMFAFLASEDAGFVTGHVYTIDGAETTGGLCSQRTPE